ncbi:prephenate dehydrogenase/arogenate dehydrogenase family protein [Candidatus Halobeggiatoa sp. HSG11]|nr:prephenate dehydrogenase/arogenate dehydrogenase family protein [Candidatus Halobeggiatoa sp. HSG11]
MLIQRLSIIGVGLIGASLASGLRRAGECNEVIGCGRGVENLRKAVDLGIIDRYYHDPAIAVKDADVVIVAVPLGSIAGIFKSINDALSPQTIITDVGSAKLSVIADARQYLTKHLPYFVPGHPIAGSEKSGVTAFNPNLFNGNRVILTSLPETDLQAASLVQNMWEIVGAKVVNMQAAYHDQVLAATSHLPHLLAYSLVNSLAKMDSKTEIFQFAAGGFRDFTRIASSDPRMWHDICLSNQDAILQMLEYFNTDLNQLIKAIQQKDSKQIEAIFSYAKTTRDELLNS